MSIAMTTVLPRAGRHLQRDAGQAVVVRLVLGLEPLAPVGVAGAVRADLGEEDRRLGRLALREDDAVLAIRVGPVLEQLAGDRRDVRVPLLAPEVDPLADVVDELVLLIRSSVHSAKSSSCLPLFRAGDRDEVGARPPARRSRS